MVHSQQIDNWYTFEIKKDSLAILSIIILILQMTTWITETLSEFPSHIKKEVTEPRF